MSIQVPNPTALFSAVDSAAITPSDTLLLKPLKAELTDINGIRHVAAATGTGGNAVTVDINLPTNEATSPSVVVTGSAVVVTLAATGTSGVLDVQGMRFESVTRGTGGNTPTVTFVDPGTTLATASVDVSGSDITLNLATDAGSKATLTNQGIVYNAVAPGTGGNDITIALVNPGTPSAPLGVTVSSNAISVNLATGPGTAQVETATGAGTVSGSGNASIVVTGSGITGSPLTIPVAVVSTDAPATWVAKVRAALAATAAITALYSVGGTGADITLTELVPNGNDGTLNIAIDTGTATGITTAATSANTTAGVAPAITSTRQQVALAVNASLTARALVTAVDPGTSTVVTAVGATNLSGGGEDAAPATTRQQALTLLRASSAAMALVSVLISDGAANGSLSAMSETALSGGSVTSSSTTQSIVNALNANEDYAALAAASCDSVELASNTAEPTALANLAGGIAGQWSIDAGFTRAITVNADGDVAYLPFNSSTSVVVAMKAGAMYPISVRKVLATGTTATGIVGHI